jgi:hypothetical protein
MGSTINSGRFSGRYNGCEDLDFTMSAAQLGTAAGTTYSPVLEAGGPKACSLTLDSLGLTAGDGLTVTVEGSEDGSFLAPALETLATFTAVSGDTAAGVTRQTKSFISLKFIRARYVTTGAAITANCTLRGAISF